MSQGERRLAAIMFTDIVGYTSLTQRDESSTLQALERNRNLLRPIFASHEGREVKTIGDAFLVEFNSALDAVQCAVAIQQMMHDRRVARGETVTLRIGIHVGDVVEKGNDILGDAVNIASRIEPLAMPGGICVSEQVYDQVKNKFGFPLQNIGKRELKNVAEQVEVFNVKLPWEQSLVAEAVKLPTNRIAILPFTSFSSNPDDGFFADGVTEEIISTVSGISGLSVTSRTSVVGYKGTTKKVSEIGRELGVGSILEGSFRKAGNKIRVTTQLIDVAEDHHLWSQNYDRNLDDVFEVQSDIAKQVAEALRVRILSVEKERIERKPTENTTAYTLYLKGRYLWNTRALDDLKKAIGYFELAIDEDPNFALGYSGQADCALLLRGNWGIDRDKNLELARSMASKALGLDPELAEAHATKGLVCSEEYDFRHAEEEFKKAIGLKPSYAAAHLWYHQLLTAQLRWEEALEQIERTLELDPLSGVAHLNEGFFYLSRRDFTKSLDWFRKAAELDYPFAHRMIAISYGMMKMFDDMRREHEVYNKWARGIYPKVDLSSDMFNAYAEGDKETVRRYLPELEAVFQDAGSNCYEIGCFHFFLGEKDKGFEWLEKSFNSKEGRLAGLKSDWDLDDVRTDPRYLDLLKRLGLAWT